MVGTALFRDEFVQPNRGGHVDLPRLERTGVRLVGLTVATSWPDLRGSLSRWHFRSLGLASSASRSRMDIARWLIARIHSWCAESHGRLFVVRDGADLERCAAPGGPIGVVIGVQGGHILDGELGNIAVLRERGVRMLAPAHVMDNELVGSGTGRRAGGLTAFGREVIAELEAQSIVLDLAHMSLRGIEDALEVARKPTVISHTGLTEVCGRPSRWRRYSPATRNIPVSVAREVGRSGGLIGVTLATHLVGGSRLENVVATITAAVDAAGEDGVAIGSDMDGALRMVIDVEGYPALAGALSDAGLSQSLVHGVMGGNALRFLRRAALCPQRDLGGRMATG